MNAQSLAHLDTGIRKDTPHILGVAREEEDEFAYWQLYEEQGEHV